MKYICGILFAEDACPSAVYEALEAAFGPIEAESERVPFRHSSYYESEMGPLERRYLAFERLAPPEALVEAKHRTNAIEDAHRRPSGGRTANLDIGYLTVAKLILATTKDYGHRIYLGRGIFADQEYRYRRGAFEPMPWTYPDYREEATRRFFEGVRKRYLAQLRALGIPPTMAAPRAGHDEPNRRRNDVEP